jgi:hypothetical protein
MSARNLQTLEESEEQAAIRINRIKASEPIRDKCIFSTHASVDMVTHPAICGALDPAFPGRLSHIRMSLSMHSRVMIRCSAGAVVDPSKSPVLMVPACPSTSSPDVADSDVAATRPYAAVVAIHRRILAGV